VLGTDCCNLTELGSTVVDLSVIGEDRVAVAGGCFSSADGSVESEDTGARVGRKREKSFGRGFALVAVVVASVSCDVVLADELVFAEENIPKANGMRRATTAEPKTHRGSRRHTNEKVP